MRIFVNGKEVNLDNLEEILSGKNKAKKEEPLYINGEDFQKFMHNIGNSKTNKKHYEKSFIEEMLNRGNVEKEEDSLEDLLNKMFTPNSNRVNNGLNEDMTKLFEQLLGIDSQEIKKEKKYENEVKKIESYLSNFDLEGKYNFIFKEMKENKDNIYILNPYKIVLQRLTLNVINSLDKNSLERDLLAEMYQTKKYNKARLLKVIKTIQPNPNKEKEIILREKYEQLEKAKIELDRLTSFIKGLEVEISILERE